MKRRTAGSEASSSDSVNPQFLTRDIVILLLDYKGGIPNQTLKESLINSGRMICDVKLTKGTDIQRSLEASSTILQDEHYRFVNAEKQKLVSTVYNKTKSPNYSTLGQMYKRTTTKIYPIIIQSEAQHCEICYKISAVYTARDINKEVNII